ncbi:putative insulin receptor substrate 4-like [Sesbania bispinosa]|nr:putative insulin receptor substrate 4-like [Sesbania bispinosa]
MEGLKTTAMGTSSTTPVKKGPDRPKKLRRKGGNGREEATKPTKVKRKLGEFFCTVCRGKKHSKQTCPVAKKQRHDEFLAQPNQGAAGQNGPAAASHGSTVGPAAAIHGPTPPGRVAASNGPTPPGPAAASHGSTPIGLVAGSHGPTPTVIGSAVEGTSLPDEIDLSQSQPPPINPSPTKSHTKVLRPKLKIREKGATAKQSPAKRMSPQKSPPPSSPNLNVEDSSKAMQFMPTPGVRTDAP